MIEGCSTTAGTLNYSRKFNNYNINNFREFAKVHISNVGMGTYLGDNTINTDNLIKQAIQKSINNGINLIDTAINYRSQKSERVVGKAISELLNANVINRDELFISTKNGYVTNDGDINEEFWTYVNREYVQNEIIHSGDISTSYHCMTIKYLEDQLERSLKNLHMDCIDLMYLHNPWESHFKDTSKNIFFQNLKSVFEFYESKIDEGKIKFYGMATWECFRTDENNPQYLSLFDVLELAKDAGGSNHGFKFIQLPFNLYLDQAYLHKNQLLNNNYISILEAAQKCGIGVFSSVPLMQGKLLNHNIIRELGNLSQSVKMLQLIRSTPGILSTLVGHKLISHVDENLKVLTIPTLTIKKFNEVIQTLLNNNQNK
ncbi:MAG: aldo/keto reductase [Nitrosopumilaceae archaeon]|nr:aldo/keto reductase [Nitrosopumilaceae archaeon]